MAAQSAAELRRDFDGAFALPLRESEPDVVDLLAIRVAGRPFALCVADVGGVAAGRRVTPVPSRQPALAGLVGMRGKLVAVFDLGTLLGLSASGDATRWLALAAGGAPLALAFDELEGHLRLPRAELHTNANANDVFLEQVLRSEGELRPIASMPRIVEAVSERTGRARPGKANE
jgi:chemotaxis signal transduction protein